MKKHFFLLTIFLCLVLVLSSCGNSSSQEEPATETQGGIEILYSFIDQFNSVSPIQIVDIEECDITDKESGHYRTEFRLTPFQTSISLVGKYSDTSFDIIAYGHNAVNNQDYEDMRIYVSGLSKEQAMEIVKYASPILDSELTNTEIDDAVNRINEYGEVNGHYYGKLGLIYSRDGSLMIKRE